MFLLVTASRHDKIKQGTGIRNPPNQRIMFRPRRNPISAWDCDTQDRKYKTEKEPASESGRYMGLKTKRYG